MLTSQQQLLETNTTGYSLGELDVATVNTTASLNMKVVGFDDEASVACRCS